MQKIVGVRFKKAGKIHYFDPGDLEIENGGQVIVETSRGVECGTVVVGPREASPEEEQSSLPVVHRLATASDIERIAENKEREKEAFDICEKKIAEHKLLMKLVDVEYTFDMGKIIFYFTADGRIDFRELVKDLAAVFRTRIELRQIGVRDEAKLMGGIGCCGRPLCCASFLGDFEPVSIRMAKDQNLSLNPTKISGICGRLMCCLKFENDCYCDGCFESKAARKTPEPAQGSRVVTVEGEGKVISLNQQRRTVTVLLDNGHTVVAAWEDVVEKDEDEDEAVPQNSPNLIDDEDDEADASLIAAITERSARAETLGGDEEQGHRSHDNKKSGRGGHGQRGGRRSRPDYKKNNNSGQAGRSARGEQGGGQGGNNNRSSRRSSRGRRDRKPNQSGALRKEQTE